MAVDKQTVDAALTKARELLGDDADAKDVVSRAAKFVDGSPKTVAWEEHQTVLDDRDTWADAASQLQAEVDRLKVEAREANARSTKLQQAYVYLHNRNKDLEKLMGEYLDKLAES